MLCHHCTKAHFPTDTKNEQSRYIPGLVKYKTDRHYHHHLQTNNNSHVRRGLSCKCSHTNSTIDKWILKGGMNQGNMGKLFLKKSCSEATCTVWHIFIFTVWLPLCSSLSCNISKDCRVLHVLEKSMHWLMASASYIRKTHKKHSQLIH